MRKLVLRKSFSKTVPRAFIFIQIHKRLPFYKLFSSETYKYTNVCHFINGSVRRHTNIQTSAILQTVQFGDIQIYKRLPFYKLFSSETYKYTTKTTGGYLKQLPFLWSNTCNWNIRIPVLIINKCLNNDLMFQKGE